MIRKTHLLLIFLTLIGLSFLGLGRLSDDNAYLSNIVNADQIISSKSSSLSFFSEIGFYLLLSPLANYADFSIMGLGIVSTVRLSIFLCIVYVFSKCLPDIPFRIKAIYLCSPILFYLPFGPLRQAVAVLLPLLTILFLISRSKVSRSAPDYSSIFASRLFLLSLFLACLIHNSMFLLFIGSLFQYLCSRATPKFSKSSIILAAFLLSLLVNILLVFILSYASSKQADTYDIILSNSSSTGVGLLLYFPLLIPFFASNSNMVLRYSFSMFLLISYFISFWFTPYSARFLEASLPFIMLSLACMGSEYRSSVSVHLFPLIFNITSLPLTILTLQQSVVS